MLATRGPHVDPPLGVVIEQRGGHLAATGVVDADEEDLGHVLRDLPLDLRERLQPLARETVHEQRHELLEPRRRKRLEGLDHVALDRLRREGPGELLAQRVDTAFEVPARDQIDLELAQLGGHQRSAPSHRQGVARESKH